MATTKNTGYRIAATAIFLLLAVAFFLQRSGVVIPTIKGFVAIPTLFAAIATAIRYRSVGKMIPLALLASTAGDWAGAQGNFIMQVAFFALAHIFYISDFAPKIDGFGWKKVLHIAPFVALMVCVLGFVVMHIEDNSELCAVAIYGVIIGSMGTSAILQSRPRKALYIVAAMLFILSDSLIAVGRFVEPIPHGNTYVMTTYYAAQGLFAYLALKREVGE
ncbi:MAG: lysoplasmalogenase [Alistipes sp.]|nr:lysoplasmalogenase [Alistipes sp.]